MAITKEAITDVLLSTGFVECHCVGRVRGFEITKPQQVFVGLYFETDNPPKFQKIGGKVHGYSKNWYFLGMFPKNIAKGTTDPRVEFISQVL